MIPLLLMVVGTPAEMAAVVRTVTPEVRADDRSVVLAPAKLLKAGTVLDTGGSGFVELHVLGVGRVRASAGSRVALPGPGGPLELLRGRLWVVSDAESRVKVAGVQVVAPRDRSLVLEVNHSGVLTVVTRGGALQIIDGAGASHTLMPGYSLIARTGRVVGQRLGGAGLADLAMIEARAHEGDRIGLERFLLDVGTSFEIGQAVRAGVRHQIRGHAEVIGAGHGTTGVVIEEGLRPPPFFEDEVPPKGPNVRVEVDFREE